MAKLTTTQREVLRLCNQPLGFYADDMSGVERRTVVRLVRLGLLAAPGGKRAYATDAGRAALATPKPTRG